MGHETKKSSQVHFGDTRVKMIHNEYLLHHKTRSNLLIQVILGQEENSATHKKYIIDLHPSSNFSPSYNIKVTSYSDQRLQLVWVGIEQEKRKHAHGMFLSHQNFESIL